MNKENIKTLLLMMLLGLPVGYAILFTTNNFYLASYIAITISMIALVIYESHKQRIKKAEQEKEVKTETKLSARVEIILDIIVLIFSLMVYTVSMVPLAISSPDGINIGTIDLSYEAIAHISLMLTIFPMCGIAKSGDELVKTITQLKRTQKESINQQ